MHSIRAKYCLVGSDLEIRENVEILLDQNNKIIEISELSDNLDQNTVIIPGLFNAHVHSADIELRQEQILDLDLETMVGPGGIKHTYLESLSPKELKQKINLSYQEALSLGTLGWADFREGGAAGVEPYPLEKNDNFVPFARPAISELAELPSYANIGIRDVRAYETDEFDKLSEYINHTDKLSFIHVSEDINLRNQWQETYGMTDVEWIIEQTTIDAMIHLTHADEADLKIIKKHDITAVLCQSSNKFTRVGLPPVELMFEYDLDMALGTDNAMFSPLSMWQEMDHYRGKVDPKKLLEMATVNGATACGRNWGINPENSNFLKLQLPNHIDDLYTWLAFECDENNIIQSIITGNS